MDSCEKIFRESIVNPDTNEYYALPDVEEL